MTQHKTPDTTMVLVASRQDDSAEWYLDWTFKNIAEEGDNRVILTQIDLRSVAVTKMWGSVVIDSIAEDRETERVVARKAEIVSAIEALKEEYDALSGSI